MALRQMDADIVPVANLSDATLSIVFEYPSVVPHDRKRFDVRNLRPEQLAVSVASLVRCRRVFRSDFRLPDCRVDWENMHRAHVR